MFHDFNKLGILFDYYNLSELIKQNTEKQKQNLEKLTEKKCIWEK